jgi:hypothetical protein
MSNSIVTVNVSEQVASAPNQLQQTGAIISQGATTAAAGTLTLLTDKTTLSATLRTPLAITSLTWAGSIVTAVTAAAHNIPSGDTVQGTIVGAVPAAYAGTFACTYVSPTSFTYPLASNPGAETTPGTFHLAAVDEVSAANNSYWGQGSAQAVYLLELGPGTPAQGVSALATWLLNPTKPVYAYLCPQSWDTESTAPTLFKQYENPTSSVYFLVTTTLATYSTWTTLPIKSVQLWLQSPLAPSAEFSAAGALYPQLATDPGPVNLVAPLAFRFVFGLTPYTTLTSSQVAAVKAAGLNWIGTGAEGGISNMLIMNGKYGDLHPWNYWYAVDWMIVNEQEALAAAVINGSNDPTNPLYYNQPGINTLQKVAQQQYNRAVQFGMAQPGGVVTAIPFTTYVDENPGDYAIGKYAGLALTFVPLRGFEAIIVQLVASDIPT